MSKIFDCPDGAKIEVRSLNAWLWRPDSCQCVLVYEIDTLELDFEIQVCRLHQTTRINDLVNTVMAHNIAINQTFGNIELTEDQIKTISTAKKAEFNRISDLGNPEIRADKNNKSTIENDLRNKGR